MQSPFYYGEAVTGENFADREREMAEICRDLEGGHNIFLISPRRYGKTSLIINALAELEERGVHTVYIDLYRVSSLTELLTVYSRAVARAGSGKLREFTEIVREFLPRLRPKVVLTSDQLPSLEIDYSIDKKEVFDLLEETYDAPQRIAQKKGEHFAVVFDEFQEITNLDGERIEKSMRAHFQHHDRVAYLFAGSKRHLIYDMISNRARAFYRMGKVMTLGKIPEEEFGRFLQGKFVASGFGVEEGVIEEVLSVTENIPFNAQFLCHELWNLSQGERVVKKANVKLALERILSGESPVYISLWDSLSLHQRAVLSAIARSGGRGVYSKEFIFRHHLGTAASVQKSVRLLEKKQILDKGNDTLAIADVFFGEWIKRMMA